MINRDGDALALEAKSDRELLLLVAAKVNQHTQLLDALSASILECPVCSNHELMAEVKTRLGNVERRMLYVAAGTVILAATALSPEMFKAFLPVVKLFLP